MCEEIAVCVIFLSLCLNFTGMCGLDNTEQQHLHTCQRSMAGANSQPCQENGDLIMRMRGSGKPDTWAGCIQSQYRLVYISMILFVSNSFDPRVAPSQISV